MTANASLLAFYLKKSYQPIQNGMHTSTFCIIVKRLVGSNFSHCTWFICCSTVIYLVLGELAPKMLSSPNPKFVVRLPLRDETNVAVLQTTKAAKQNASRKTITKNGEWLTTKAAPVKRKNAATAKPKPVKKTKVKPTKKPVSKVATKTKPAKARTTGASAEVIELSSDEDDSEPDVR